MRGGVLAALVFAFSLGGAGCTLARGVASTGDGGRLPDVGQPDAFDAGQVDHDAGEDAGDATVPKTDTGVDGGTLPTLDLTTGGTFTRASEASYLMGGASDGSRAFLAWAPVDARRMEDRGDGLGPMLLLEGARTNYVVDSRALSAPGAFGPLSVPDVAQGPDGAMLADRSTVATGQYADLRSLALTGVRATGSFWGRRPTGTGADVAHLALDLGGVGAGVERPLAETYSRPWVTGVVTTPSVYYVPVDGRTGVGLTARALDYIHDLHQVELGAFPSSAIRTSTSAATRAADLLSYAPGSYPDELRTSGFRIQFAPDFSSDDVLAEGPGSMHFVFDFGTANDGLVFRNMGGTVAIVAGTNGGAGGQVVMTGPVTFTRGQRVTLEVRPSSLVVSGLATGDGTFAPGAPLVWPAASLIIGASDGSCFGRFGTVIQSL